MSLTKVTNSMIDGAYVNLLDFGAVGNGIADDTTAIQNWLTYCSDNKLVGYVPVGRFKYTGSILTQPWVCIRGAGAPKPNATDSALVGGSIFQGLMRFSGTNIDIQDLGVDCGVDSGLGAVDVLIVSTGAIYQGEYCRLENVIGLGRAAGDAAHAILVEGYDNVSIDTVTGIRTYYGLAAKVKKASIRNVKGYQNSVAGCILRSNSPDGLCEDIIVDGVITVGEGSAGSGSGGSNYGFYLVADSAAQRIIINNIKAENALNTVAIRPNATINELIIDNVVTRLSGQSALGFLPGAGTLYSCIVNNVVGVELTAWLSRIESTVNQIQMQNMFGSGSTSFGYLDEMIRVESTVQATHFDNVQLVENYSLATLGCIRYNNSYPNNTLGSNIRAKPQDATAGGITTGIPQPGYQFSSASGATVTLSPNYSPTGVTTIKSERSNVASTVTVVSNAYNPSQRFATGSRLIIINADTSTLTISSSAVATKSGSDIVMAAGTAAMFVYGGAGWYEI